MEDKIELGRKVHQRLENEYEEFGLLPYAFIVTSGEWEAYGALLESLPGSLVPQEESSFAKRNFHGVPVLVIDEV